MTTSVDNHDYYICYNNYHNYNCCFTPTQNGKSPLDLACDQRYYNTQEVIEILEAHGNKPDAQTK